MSAGCLRTDGSIDLAKLRLDRIARGEIITRLLRTYSRIQFLQLRFDAVSGHIVVAGLLRADRGIQSRDIGCGRIGRFRVIRAGHRTQFRVRRPAGQNTGIPTCHSAGRRRRNLVAAVDRNIRPRRVTTAGTNATNLESSPIIVILHRHRAISTHCIRRVLDVICKNLTAGNKSRIAGRNRAGRQRREHRTIDRFDHIRRCSAGSRRKRNRLRCRRRLRTHFRDLRFDIIRSRVQRSIRRLRRTEFRIQFLQLRFDAVSGRIVVAGLLCANRRIQSLEIRPDRGTALDIRAARRIPVRIHRAAGNKSRIARCNRTD